MSITTAVSRSDNTGNGATIIWSFPFKIFANADIQVWVKNIATGLSSQLVLDLDYSVTGAGLAAGGSITQLFGSAGQFFTTTMTSAYTISIIRVLAVTQPYAFVNQGQFFAKSHEDSFDRVVMLQQMIADQLSRTLQLPITEAGDGVNDLLPSKAARASMYLGFDASGNPKAIASAAPAATVSSFMAPVLLAADAPAARLALGAEGVRYATAPNSGNDTYTITVSPAPVAYADGQLYAFEVQTSNTGAATLNVNGLGAVSLLRSNLTSLQTNDILANQTVLVRYRASGPSFAIISAGFDEDKIIRYDASATGTDGYSITVANHMTGAAAHTVGQVYQFKADVTNTGACSLTVNTTAAKAIKVIVAGAKADPPTGTIVAGDFVSVIYDGTDMVILSLASKVAQKSEVYLSASGAAGASHGSTNTKIRRFLTTVKSTGTAITYADSATLGGTFTINEGGVYAISYNEREDTTYVNGVSLNSSQLTTNIQSITNADRLGYTAMGIASTGSGFRCISMTTVLAQGDVIRAHTNGAMSDVTDGVNFRITKIA